MQLKILVDTPKLISIALSGALDWVSVGEIEPEFTKYLTGDGQNVIVDMSDVPSITSMGLGMLIKASKVVKQKNAKFVILKPQPVVESVIQISGLSEMLCVSVDDAAAQHYLSADIAS